MRRLHLSLLAASLLSASIPAQQAADHLALGKMWTFESPPLAYLEQEYGFKPDQKWLDSLRLGALRLGERDNPWCSASFVSPKGLIMTNHHCVRDEIAQVQGPKDWVKSGFAATSLEDEVRIPGLTVHQLISQEDITKQVERGIAATDDDVTAASKRKVVEASDEADFAPTKAAAMPNPGTVLRRPQSVGVKTALLGGAKSAMEAYNRISPKGRKISCSLAFISDFSALYCEATSTIKAIITTDNPRALTTMANVLHRPLSP
mgnify:CR=1 FL=1